MDSDLEDLYLHADQVTPAGLRSLVATVQRERETIRDTLAGIQEHCTIIYQCPTAQEMEKALLAIDVFVNGLENLFEVGCQISWQDMVRRA